MLMRDEDHNTNTSIYTVHETQEDKSHSIYTVYRLIRTVTHRHQHMF